MECQTLGEEVDELTPLFRKWNKAEFLLDFFMENFRDLLKSNGVFDKDSFVELVNEN